MTIYEIFTIIALGLLGGMVTFGIVRILFTDTNSGIYAHPTGEAAYIAGEACVINDLPEIDFQTMGAWCNAQRTAHK